jgi:hypothetical protein
MTTVDQATAAARRLARSAAAANTGTGSCPYPADGAPVQSAARRAWLRTYLHIRPPKPGDVSYDDDLAALAAGDDSTDDPTTTVADQGALTTTQQQ